MNPEDNAEVDAYRDEWRRLRRAAGFFVACVLVFLAVAAIGLYH